LVYIEHTGDVIAEGIDYLLQEGEKLSKQMNSPLTAVIIGYHLNAIVNYLAQCRVDKILVADNGSKDNSKEIALESGARVIDIDNKGYGNALIEGIKQAKRKVYNYGR